VRFVLVCVEDVCHVNQSYMRSMPRHTRESRIPSSAIVCGEFVCLIELQFLRCLTEFVIFRSFIASVMLGCFLESRKQPLKIVDTTNLALGMLP